MPTPSLKFRHRLPIAVRDELDQLVTTLRAYLLTSLDDDGNLDASGLAITNLDADELSTGTVPLSRLSGITDTQIAAAAAIAWSKISKVGAVIGDFVTLGSGLSLVGSTLSVSGAGANNVLDVQGPTGTLTGDSTDQTVFTTTIPAAALVAGSIVRVTCFNHRVTGTAAMTTKLHFGGTSVTAESAVGTANVVSFWQAMITVVDGTNQILCLTGNRSAVTITNQIATPAEAISGQIVLKFTFNVNNTSTYVGKAWTVEILN